MDPIPPKLPDYGPPNVKAEYQAAHDKKIADKMHVTVAKAHCYCSGCEEIRNRPMDNAKVLFKDQ